MPDRSKPWRRSARHRQHRDMTPTPAIGHPRTSSQPATRLRAGRAGLRLLLLGPLCLALGLSTGCTAFKSDQEQVRDAIQTYYDSFAEASAKNDIEMIAKNACDRVAAELRKTEGSDSTGSFSATVDSISDIQVVGDSATASVVFHTSTKPDPRSYVATVIKERGNWKFCTWS
ncbi:hypothetical protein [Microlunatus sp. GCM10028923]|uniref:Rv0361 family membrane protein n=1 Tax=Microlunatus sp. GCM10028923 TaxID=3273400 RepID=UPI00361076DA